MYLHIPNVYDICYTYIVYSSCQSCGFNCQPRVLKMFPGPNYLSPLCEWDILTITILGKVAHRGIALSSNKQAATMTQSGQTIRS